MTRAAILSAIVIGAGFGLIILDLILGCGQGGTCAFFVWGN